MKNKSSILNTKYLKTGGYSVLVSVIAIAIIIVVNLFVNQLPTSWTQFDLSSSDILSITDETTELVKAVEDDVTIYYIVQNGGEDTYITTMLDKYKELNDKITVEHVDPALNPAFFTGDKASLSENSLMVETEKRNKIITSVDIYYPGYTEEDLYNYYYQYGSMPSATGFDFEGCMTSAINYVTTDILPVIYALTGHGETALSDDYIGYLTDESMEVQELNLATLEAVPEDADCVLVCAPETDISADESERLLAYLKAGGKMMYISNFSYTVEEEHTNMQAVLEYYGVSASEGVIFEGDSSAHYPNYPYILLAKYGSHEIVTPLSGYYMFMGYSQGIVTSEELRDTVTVTPLLYTSDAAYSKVNLNSETTEKEEGDLEGPFDYAVAVTETNEDGTETQIVWINSPMIIDSSMDYYGTSEAMFVNSFGWMCGKEDSISIPAKELEQEMLTVTEAQGTILTTVFAIIIPLTAVVTGFVVWFRRRSK